VVGVVVVVVEHSDGAVKFDTLHPLAPAYDCRAKSVVFADCAVIIVDASTSIDMTISSDVVVANAPKIPYRAIWAGVIAHVSNSIVAKTPADVM
jgi:hypothetical protein